VFAQIHGGGSNLTAFIELGWRSGVFEPGVGHFYITKRISKVGSQELDCVLTQNGKQLKIEDDLNQWVTWQLTWYQDVTEGYV